MESTYPHFKFANNGWKLDYLASNTYPAWRKGKLDDNSKWKQKKGKGCKVEEDDDNNNNNNNSSDEVGMKCKALALKLEESAPGKWFKERGTEQHGSNAIIPIDPLAALALAASKARDIPLPPLSDTLQESRSSSMGSNDAMLNTNPILELQHAILPAAMPTPSTIPTKVDNAPVVGRGLPPAKPAPATPNPAPSGPKVDRTTQHVTHLEAEVAALQAEIRSLNEKLYKYIASHEACCQRNDSSSTSSSEAATDHDDNPPTIEPPHPPFELLMQRPDGATVPDGNPPPWLTSVLSRIDLPPSYTGALYSPGLLADYLPRGATDVLKLHFCNSPPFCLTVTPDSFILLSPGPLPTGLAGYSAKGGSKAKMRPGPAKNGRNLCAHRWCKQVQSSGSTEEFQKYYNSLTATQRMEYDNEAIALATSSTWDTKSICNGTLY
ncbi:hypothetical protein EDD15DRAFT_2197400 [Pisolithus albus]|nr:hypothetical protein EDD15DRAFT_2197400 [Pisolithus albus]